MAEMKIKKNVETSQADRLGKMIRGRLVGLSDAYKQHMEDEVAESIQKIQLWVSILADMYVEE